MLLDFVPIHMPRTQKVKTLMSKIGVREDLLIKKVSINKMGVLVVPQIHLTKVQCSGFFYVKGRENGRRCLD